MRVLDFGPTLVGTIVEDPASGMRVTMDQLITAIPRSSLYPCVSLHRIGIIQLTCAADLTALINPHVHRSPRRDSFSLTFLCADFLRIRSSYFVCPSSHLCASALDRDIIRLPSATPSAFRLRRTPRDHVCFFSVYMLPLLF